MRVFLFLLFGSLLTACAGTVPVNYQAQTLVREDGKAAIGDFTYEPFEKGKVKSNQIQNTAIGSVYIALDVSDLVKRATALEMEKAGVTLSDKSNISVSGSVIEFKADDLGFNVDWYYSVDYKITDRTTGKTLYEKTYTPSKVRTGKFGMAADFAPSVNETIRSGVEAFISDKAVKEIFAAQLVPPSPTQASEAPEDNTLKGSASEKADPADGSASEAPASQTQATSTQ